MKIIASIAYRWKIFANSLRAHVLKHLFGIENAEKLLVQIQINYFQKNKLGFCGQNTIIENPVHFENPSSIYLDDNTKVRSGCHIINGPKEKVVLKKYSVIAANCLIVTNSHVSTTTIPHFLLGGSHINDKSCDIVIEEDVWIGAGVTLLAGAHLGRGCIVAAGAIVSKEVPPYALVAGIPAKIIAYKFDIDGILKHENALYTRDERLSRQYLETIFDTHFKDKKQFGKNQDLTSEQTQLIERLKISLNYVKNSNNKL